MALSDMKILQILLADHRLSDREREVFEDMQERLDVGFRTGLSKSQRTWVDEVYNRLELDDEQGSQNLVSSGVVAKEVSKKKYAFEKFDRPMLPPHKLAQLAKEKKAAVKA